MIDFIQINLLKVVNQFITSKTLRKRISTFYLVKAYNTLNKLTNAKKEKFSAKKIKTILFLSGINFTDEEDNFYYILLNLITDKKNIIENRNYLEHQLKNKKFKYLEPRSWLRLRDLFYLRFELTLGAICRKNALDCILKNKINFFINKKNKARVILEKALDSDNFQKFLLKFPLEYKFSNKTLGNFLLSTCKDNLNFKRNSKEIIHKKFHEILENKSVAIVGSAESYDQNASEIDSFDTVIRFNYSYSGKNLDKIINGVKTDISYFNGDIVDYIINYKNGKFPDDLKVACIKDNNNSRISYLKKANSNIEIRKISNYNALTFSSSFNLLPLTLLDVLESNPKYIKIFHSDLFLTMQRTKNYYPNTVQRDKNLIFKIISESFLDHDPVVNHKILKKIYQFEKIQGDFKFNEVMNLDTNKYLKKLEDIYK